jgi:hypothetical protein
MSDAADMFVDALNAIRDIRDKAKELGQAPPDSFDRADPLMTDKARELEQGAGRVRDALPGLHDSLEKALESGRAARAMLAGKPYGADAAARFDADREDFKRALVIMVSSGTD